MRGVSGSGKSTTAEAIARGHRDPNAYFEVREGVKLWISGDGDSDTEEIHSAIHSTDQFFVGRNGYHFWPEKLKENHQRNIKAFRKSCEQGIPIVICDNTNTRKWEWQFYENIAKKNGYIVTFVEMPHPEPEIAANRNIHSVSKEIIELMIEGWESR